MNTLRNEIEQARAEAQHEMYSYPGAAEGSQYAKGRLEAYTVVLDILARHAEEPAGLRADAIRLRNCLRVLTDGTGDGYGPHIAEGRRAVMETGYLDHPAQEGQSATQGAPDPCHFCGGTGSEMHIKDLSAGIDLFPDDEPDASPDAPQGEPKLLPLGYVYGTPAPAAPDCPWCTRDGRTVRALELQWVCEHCGFRGSADDYEHAEPTLVAAALARGDTPAPAAPLPAKCTCHSLLHLREDCPVHSESPAAPKRWRCSECEQIWAYKPVEHMTSGRFLYSIRCGGPVVPEEGKP